MDVTNTTPPKSHKTKAARAAKHECHQQEPSAQTDSSTTVTGRFNDEEVSLMIQYFMFFYLDHNRNSLLLTYTMAIEALVQHRIRNQDYASESFPTLDEFYNVVRPHFSDDQIMAARYGRDEFFHFPKRDNPPEPCPSCRAFNLAVGEEEMSCDYCN